jgi:hypothetical protein
LHARSNALLFSLLFNPAAENFGRYGKGLGDIFVLRPKLFINVKWLNPTVFQSFDANRH